MAGARVPLVIRWPGVSRAGTVIESFVSLTDLAPTLLEGAGIKPPDAMTGRSLLPLLRGESQADAIASSSNGSAMRTCGKAI